MKIRHLITSIEKQISPLDGILFTKNNSKDIKIVSISISYEKKELIIQNSKIMFRLSFDKEIEIDDVNGSFEFVEYNEEYSLVILVPLFRRN